MLSINQLEPIHIIKSNQTTVFPQFSLLGCQKENYEIQENSQEEERKLHLAFLFAGPLVTAYKDDEKIKIKPMPTLEYQKEIDQIVQNAAESSQGIKYKKCVATLDNFQHCMNEMPLALHFTGHGIKNTAFGTDKVHEGDFLVFEDDNGKAQYVSCQVLKGIIKACPKQPEFVFVSSCHSRLVGDVFKSAGAKHVICVKRSEKIMDEVAILFAQEFYKAFFLPYGTVCSAFEVAKTKVMAKTAEHVDHTPFLAQGTEHMKFELLIGGEYSAPHNCANLHPVPIGKPLCLSPPLEFHSIPSKVEHFVGRKCELYNVISLINDSRIVTIKGLPGIGKTSMAKIVSHFFMERKTFSDGIIYISARGVESSDAFITQLHVAIKSASDTVSVQTKDKLAQILAALQSKHVLLIIDNAEDPLNKDKAQFVNLIHTILDQLPLMKILVTSRMHLGSLSDLTEKVFNLAPLDPRSSVLLLEKRAPRLIKSSEIDELLLEESPNQSNPSAQALAQIPGEDYSLKLEEHGLMQLLAGHPQAISLAAALLQGRRLKEIYQELMSSSLRANEMHSLKLSLSLSLERVKTRNPDSVKFFKMMGLFPSGAYNEEMKTFWGANYKEHINNLQDVSLLVRRETGDLQEDRYWLLPFMADYALNYLKEYDISEMFQRGCEYYGKKLETIFMNDAISAGSDNLIKEEPNIVAFLAYGSGNKENDEKNEDEKSEILDAAGVAGKPEKSDILLQGTKELIPSREAAEMLGSEESKLSGSIHISEKRSKMFFDSKRRKSETLQEFSLPPLSRLSSENSHNMSIPPVRELSLTGVEEENKLYVNTTSGNDSMDPDTNINISNDDENINKKRPQTAKQAQNVKAVMTVFGKLLVYYCANLLMSHRYNDAIKTIQNYVDSPNIVTDILARANLYKLLGLVYDKLQELQKQKDYVDSKNYFCKAKQLFFKSDSYLGQAACLVALGEIERQQGEYEKAKWSYENALRHYLLINHSYGVALSHSALALIKDKLSLKKQSKEHVIQARLVRESQGGIGGNAKNYNGGVFVSRWEGGPSAFIIEIAKVGSGIFYGDLCVKIEAGIIENKKRPTTIQKAPFLSKKHQFTMSKTRVTKALINMNKLIQTASNQEIFSIAEEESKELATEIDNKIDIRDKKKQYMGLNKKPKQSLNKSKISSKESSVERKKLISRSSMKKSNLQNINSSNMKESSDIQNIAKSSLKQVKRQKQNNGIKQMMRQKESISNSENEENFPMNKKVTKGVKGLKGKLE